MHGISYVTPKGVMTYKLRTTGLEAEKGLIGPRQDSPFNAR